MNEYRAYILGTDGHFVSCRTFRYADDIEAIIWAKQLVDCQDIELWSGERFVTKLTKPAKRGWNDCLARLSFQGMPHNSENRKEQLERRLEQSRRLLKAAGDKTTVERIGHLICDLEQQQS